MQVLVLEDLEAPRVDDLALLVHHLVVLEDLLALLGVATLDRVLGPLDRLRHHLRLDGLVVGEGPVHHPADRAGGEQPHELVLELQEEPALARVALATRAPAQLVVDAAGLVALGPEHVEPARPRAPSAPSLGTRRCAARSRPRARASHSSVPGSTPWPRSLVAASTSALPPRTMSTPRPAMFVATVTAPGRPAWATISASRKCCLALRTSWGTPRLSSRRDEVLGLGHRRGADEDRLAAVAALDDVLDDRLELRLLGLVDEVRLVAPLARARWWGSGRRTACRCCRTRRPRSRPCRSCRRASRRGGSSSAG